MTILDWSGYAGYRGIDEEELEPYVLPIVLRLEKDEELLPTHEEAQLAVAAAVLGFFDSEKTAPGGAWRESTDKWLAGRIRKVARRARGKEWDTVRKMDGIYAKYGNAEVIILPPHPNFAAPAEIKKLQVSGLDLERKPITEDYFDGLGFSVNPNIEMSTGKTLAQVGHAVQLTIFRSSINELKTWEEASCPFIVLPWEAKVSWDAIIHDAGFTEVAPGSETARGVLL